MRRLIKVDSNWLLVSVKAALRLSGGLLFLWHAVPQVHRPYSFLANVYEYELVGPRTGILIAMVLPWLELLLGICLIGGVFLGGALLASTVLLGVASVAQVAALNRGLESGAAHFDLLGKHFQPNHAVLAGTIAAFLVAAAAYGSFLLSRRG